LTPDVSRPPWKAWKRRGLDLGRVSTLVLSHGHYGHTAGLGRLLRYLDREIDVIVHPGIWDKNTT
jgi:metal-dependent hydrolase (beta-lactamase superfamily II)